MDINLKDIHENMNKIKTLTNVVANHESAARRHKSLEGSLHIYRYILPGESGNYIDSLYLFDKEARIKIDSDFYKIWEICPVVELRETGDVIREIHLKSDNK